MKPIEFCNQVSESFKRLCQAANIEYSSFERTTNPHHKKAVNELWVIEEREREREKEIFCINTRRNRTNF